MPPKAKFTNPVIDKTIIIVYNKTNVIKRLFYKGAYYAP